MNLSPRAYSLFDEVAPFDLSLSIGVIEDFVGNDHEDEEDLSALEEVRSARFVELSDS